MDQKTIATYGELAEEYDQETADFLAQFPADFLDVYAATLKEKGERLLDIGSGPGRDAELLRDRSLSLTCLDASTSMVAMTADKGFESVHGDLLNLPFLTETFGGVWAHTSLLHVKKSEMPIAFAEIRRVLEPGGILGLGLIEGSGEEYRHSSGMARDRLFSFYMKEEVENMLTEFGFEHLHFETFQPGGKRYMNFISRKTS